MPADLIKLRMAIRDFQAAHQSAAIQEVLARLRGRSNDLLSYEEVARMLRLRGSSDAGNRPIPIKSIVGTVGRYTDFTRTFLPRNALDQERWSRVKTAFMEQGLPPIEVYKVGEAYFVLDGNHRVSIARQEGMEYIDAHVVEVRTDIPLTPDMKPDDLIIKAEYAEFLEATGIMGLRPNVDLSVTVPGQYQKLLEQIYACEYVCRQEEGVVEGCFERGIEEWYDQAYTPLIEAIRDRGLLRWFPGRTLTDLYVWITENRMALAEQFGWEIQSDAAAADLILKRSTRQTAGEWRKARTISRYTDRLFADILVPLSGDLRDWDPLDQAIQIAGCENSVLHGLHVASSAEAATSPQVQALQEEFARRCEQQGVKGRLVIETGAITDRIRERAAIADLVVLKLMNPPRSGLAALQSPFRAVIANSPRPVLALPGKPTGFNRAILAYDGSALAREALFVAAYLAEMWKTELVVFTSLEGNRVQTQAQDHVRRYLEIHEVEAKYVFSDRDPASTLQRALREMDADLLLIGSYGGPAIREIVAGSVLDHMLRESPVPVFICR